MESPDCSWMQCTLCRTSRQGSDTLRRARERGVVWPHPNTGLVNPIEEPVIHTSLDDAFASMLQFMSISTRKCKRYHGSHAPHARGSQEERHALRFHSPLYTPAINSNPLCQPTNVQVSAAPGSYSISAARSGPGRGKETTHVVRLEPGKSVSVTLSV